MSDNVSLAIDLGTTTIAASLTDPSSGARLAAGGALNPQRVFGADVLTRLAAAVESRETLREMSRMVNAALASLAGRLLADAGLTVKHLAQVAIAGNPAMEHLLIGMPVDSLARVPYRPAFTSGRRINTGQLGWGFPVDAYLFPLPGGFVGGDLVAFLYGQLTGVYPLTSHVSHLFLDLGTNAEIALVTPERIYATSAAAGPAFEGGNLSCGMPALPGAISGVTLVDDRLSVATIAGAPPTGICGTGVLSAIATLLAAGVIDSNGRLVGPSELDSNLANRLVDREGEAAFVLHRDSRHELLLTQGDVRQMQLAKAAVRAGIEILFQRAGGAPAGAALTVTGSFGSAIAADLLRGLGFLPQGVGVVDCVSDGALAGVERLLVRKEAVAEVECMLHRLKVLPLSGNPEFEARFINAIDF